MPPGVGADKKKIPSLLDLRSVADGDVLASAARRSVTRPRFNESRASQRPQVPLLPGPLPPSGLPQMMRIPGRPPLIMMPPPPMGPPGFYPQPPPGYVPGGQQPYFAPPMGMQYAGEQCFGGGPMAMANEQSKLYILTRSVLLL